MPDALAALLLLGAGLLAGVSNSIAGGGTFFSFPAFLAVGLPPIVANASNALAVWPANVVAAISYRKELTDARTSFKASIVIALVGGALGAGLLAVVGNEAFSKLIPELMSNLVYRLHDSGGFPADCSLVDSVNEVHTGDHVGELAKAA